MRAASGAMRAGVSCAAESARGAISVKLTSKVDANNLLRFLETNGFIILSSSISPDLDGRKFP
jgi:hypothetical protein